ncbi:MAG: hypothetical protein O4806_07430 [Trichodesmium sp. St5_bin8]|nr:hypothetical protein [Trichodesmium sp. St5_bin8]
MNGLDFPAFLSWVYLKRDGIRIKSFVISTKPMKGQTIASWGRRRWKIEEFTRRELNIVLKYTALDTKQYLEFRVG